MVFVVSGHKISKNRELLKIVYCCGVCGGGDIS